MYRTRPKVWMLALIITILASWACSLPGPEPGANRTEEPSAQATGEETEEAAASPTPRPTQPPQGANVPPRGNAEFPPAAIQNDEGGPVVITGDVTYTNTFFTAGVAQPIVILEDQGGFVERDRNFVIPLESQVMGAITSDFTESPFTYTINVPEEPSATLNDVDHDGETDTGVIIYAVAYWTNTWGDPFLEERDQGGGGWSSAYASTRVSDDRASFLEVYGGKYVIYAPDGQEGFPSGFGDDGRLFTDDDPIVSVPQGWTVVDMDIDPFTFDRSSQPVIDLIEPESSALDDFSEMSYTEAFDAMLEKFRTEYAFTEYKRIDWDQLGAEFRPRFEEAEQNRDTQAYYLALRDFIWSIPDTHVGMDISPLNDMFQAETSGGLGMSLSETDEGRILVTYVVDNGPADQAGIVYGAEILDINNQPIDEAVDAAVPWSSPFSNPVVKRLQQLRYVIRFPVGTTVAITFRNPGGGPVTRTMTTVQEVDSFRYSSFYRGVTGNELPVEFSILDNGYGYVRVYSFFDNDVLTIQLWERMIQTLNQQGLPGLIIDLRQNGGGSGWLADQMAAYFFDDRLPLGNAGFYDDSTGEFYFDQGDTTTLIPPPDEDLRYHGPIALIVGPACASACEFFAWNMTLQDRAQIVGHYPTAGAGGSVEQFLMPEGETVTMTVGRAVDNDGNIHIETHGVVPTVHVPVTVETLAAENQEGRDVLLEAAIQTLESPPEGGSSDQGESEAQATEEATQEANATQEGEQQGQTPSGPPHADGSGDLVDIVQGGTPILNDMAREQYDVNSQPGETYVYTINMRRSEDVVWLYSWCTSSEDLLRDNWSKIELEVAVDGEEIQLDDMGVYEAEVQSGLFCRYYWTVLSDWPPGEHILTHTVTFTEALNDGFDDYPAGTHVYEYHVTVGG